MRLSSPEKKRKPVSLRGRRTGRGGGEGAFGDPRRGLIWDLSPKKGKDRW